MKNLFCSSEALVTEADVERCVVERMILWLGYKDECVKAKGAIEDLRIGKGSKRAMYRPDYVLLHEGYPYWLIDAKAPSENLDKWIEQCASYALVINRRQPPNRRVRYFMITNGIETRVYRWDQDKPLLTITFEEMVEGSDALAALRDLVGSQALTSSAEGPAETRVLVRPSPSLINSVFSKCNNLIYKRDNISPAAAFHEFVKIVFLKIRADRELHRKFPSEMLTGKPVPTKEITFSTAWLDRVGADTPGQNPLNLQFERLVRDLEDEIRTGSKKRIYAEYEKITLQPTTVRDVVAALDGYDLFGIDEDLNGRLFEAFLNSTMRGKALGQYFTPRSVVNLMTFLAAPRATLDHVDTVIDPCCGSGGFLIKALAVMAKQVDDNTMLSGEEKRSLHRKIRHDAIFGIDVGRDPPIARIARINMYLHGDGGSRIYVAEALDKTFENQGTLNPEQTAEIAELKRTLLASSWPGFDIILTNPPFSKEYDAATSEQKKILSSYQIKLEGKRSAVLFLERYRDLLKPGGKLLAVVDDSLLGNARYKSTRDFIRKHFIVRAVISLPGDAFQRSGARVKTSILYLTKRASLSEIQPDVFMWYCTAIGVDDSARQRPSREDADNIEAAKAEIHEVMAAYEQARSGASRAHLVPHSRVGDRLDVKSCVLRSGRKLKVWEELGFDARPLGDWVAARSEPDSSADFEIVRLLSVSYSGEAKEPEELVRESINYPTLYVVHEGDIVVSNINAVNGAICVVPIDMDGAVVSSEFTVLVPKSGVNAYALCAILRSPEMRAELLTRSSGLGRTRVSAEMLLPIPIPSPISAPANKAEAALEEARRMESSARALREAARRDLEESMDLGGEEADRVIKAFKPPR